MCAIVRVISFLRVERYSYRTLRMRTTTFALGGTKGAVYRIGTVTAEADAGNRQNVMLSRRMGLPKGRKQGFISRFNQIVDGYSASMVIFAL